MKKLYFIPLFILFAQIAQAQEFEWLLMSGQYQEAIENGEKLLENDSLDAGLFYKMGLAHRQLNEYPKANHYFEKSVQLDTLMVDYRIAYAQNLGKMGYEQRAIEQYLKALEKEPHNFSALNQIAQMYLRAQKFDKAITIYERMSRLYPNNSFYFRQMGYCALKLNDGIQAYKHYQNAYMIDSTDVKNITSLANLYLRAGHLDDCIAKVNWGIQVDSNFVEFYKIRAKAYFNRNHNYLAVDDFKKCIELGDSTAYINKYLGISYNLIEKPKQAHPYLEAAYQADTTDNDITLYLGRNYLQMDSFETSLKYFNKTLDLITPSNYLMHNIYNEMMSANSGLENYIAALQCFEKRRQITEFVNTNDYYRLALIYDKLDNKKEAVKCYELYINELEYLQNKDSHKQYQFALSRKNHLKEEMHMQNSKTD